MWRSVIEGVGSYLPEKILTNEDLSHMVDTSDEWITSRTGIKKRHLAEEGQFTSHLAIEAAKNALQDAGIKPEDIDLVICATTTPDRTFPATAATVQRELGILQGAAFDVQAACAGFIYALTTADNFLSRGQFKNAIVVGAETLSRLVNWSDRNVAVLFGDGAGAFVLSACEEEHAEGRGILSSYLRCDGRYEDMLYADGGPSSTQSVGEIKMIGKQVFKHAVNNLSSAVLKVIEEADYELDDIDWFVPHQANQRIISKVGEILNLDENRVVSTVSEHANTSAASIPLAFDSAKKSGQIKQGQVIAFEAMGGGFSWGACLVRL